MGEYLEAEKVLDDSNIITVQTREYGSIDVITVDCITDIEYADVKENKYCRMIPLEPDCRNCTDVFICTNCHHHIHLGFIREKYSGSYCLECGAEVKDGVEHED